MGIGTNYPLIENMNQTFHFSLIQSGIKKVTQDITVLGMEVLSHSIPAMISSSLIELEKHPYWKKVVIGSGYTLSGFVLMYKSQVPQACWNIFRHSTQQSIQKKKLTSARLGGFMIGMGTALYGMYTLSTTALNIDDNQDADKQNDLQDNMAICYPGASYTKTHLSSDSSEAKLIENEKKSKQIIGYLNKCPAAKEIYESVTAKGPIHIVLNDPLNDPILNKNQFGYWHHLTRRIVINRQVSDIDKLVVALFEVINAEREEEQHKVGLKGYVGEFNPIEFTKAIERLEFDTSKKHCITLEKCIKNNYWPFMPFNDAHCKEALSKDFDVEWETTIKQSEHAKFYIDYWYKHYQVNYCHNHPLCDPIFCQSKETVNTHPEAKNK